jgi:hypothetical protein
VTSIGKWTGSIAAGFFRERGKREEEEVE